MTLTAVVAVILLTAGTANRTRAVVELTDHQMSQLIGGEKEMSCLDQLVTDVLACAGKATVEEISSCKASAEIGYFWCRVWSFVSWIFSWIL